VTSWQATYPGIVPQPYIDSLGEEEFAGRWQKRIQDDASMSICVAEVDDVLCGFASAGPIRKPVSSYDGELYAIYLLPTGQRKGIGRELFAQIMERLASRGLKSLLVWTLSQNPAVGFYEYLGGERVTEDVIEIGGAALPEVSYGWSNLAIKSWK
jgi:GNAT superfamily N-acetyltransferase